MLPCGRTESSGIWKILILLKMERTSIDKVRMQILVASNNCRQYLCQTRRKKLIFFWFYILIEIVCCKIQVPFNCTPTILK